ncbi:GNAT family N-acetyltransferase [Nonomuraea terrae]|uniref:GNAT family N-acetyltransferase n=1 Tax=Nonomuraea terrae TaxID=2530383 RepID=UPI001FE96502|nr:GNAT family N-acetyltransferase [Nonomuraea terrae]
MGEIHAESWKSAYAGFFAPEFFAEAVRERRGKWHAVLAEGPERRGPEGKGPEGKGLEGKGPEGNGTVMLAAVDGRPLAFSFFGRSPARPGSAELFGFYGHPDGWGSGVAGALMTASLSAMREAGFDGVHLWTLRDTPQSRRFYAKNGFTESGAVRAHDFGDGHPIEQVEYRLIFG